MKGHSSKDDLVISAWSPVRGGKCRCGWVGAGYWGMNERARKISSSEGILKGRWFLHQRLQIIGPFTVRAQSAASVSERFQLSEERAVRERGKIPGSWSSGVWGCWRGLLETLQRGFGISIWEHLTHNQLYSLGHCKGNGTFRWPRSFSWNSLLPCLLPWHLSFCSFPASWTIPLSFFHLLSALPTSWSPTILSLGVGFFPFLFTRPVLYTYCHAFCSNLQETVWSQLISPPHLSLPLCLLPTNPSARGGWLWKSSCSLWLECLPSSPPRKALLII